jgi:drug/metabolite transporter (DMT)-like permease
VPTSALLLALAAAAFHAVWNLLLARAGDPEAATAVALVVATIAFAPVAALTWDVEREAWPWIGASAALELVYFVLLAAAYRRAEFGLVYPLARGLAPVLVLAVGVVALGTDPTAGQALAVGVIAAGVLLVRGFRGADGRGTAFAVGIAACIAAYTLVDKEGMRHAAPLSYLEVVLVWPALAYAGAVVALKGGVSLRREIGLAPAVAGVIMFGSFALTLAALGRAPAAPVAALRETGVVWAALLAALVLRERVSPGRFAGAVLVAAGIAILALA